jgi:hypothetical protein
MSEILTSGQKLVADNTPTAGESTNSDQWIKSRLCFCNDDAPTDCRFHSPKEAGWEQCPNTEAGRAGKAKGRWLWMRNPNFGKISEAAEESLLVDPD